MPPLTLSVLTLLSPAWALGLLAAVGLPVLAHLLSRSRYLPVDFPGTRFAIQAAVETRRINRPRHILLLLLRVLALAAVAGAFMQPRWDTQAAAITGTRGECVVLILDASASMQRAQRGETLFDQARRLAHQQLDSLTPQRDRAVVLLAGARPQPLLREPSGNFSLLRDRLDGARCSYEAADLAGAVALADTVIAQQERPGRVTILSDGQASNRPAIPLQTPRSGAPLTELRVGGEPANNLAVRLIEASPFPPVSGMPLDLTVEVRNDGQASTAVTLRSQGGLNPTSHRLTLGPGAATTQTLTLHAPEMPTTPGPIVFRVGLETDDGFTPDNETGLVTTLAQARPVKLVTESVVSQDSTAARITIALSPDRKRPDESVVLRPMTTPFHVTRHTPSAIAAEAGAADDAAACWVVTGLQDVPPPAFLESLEEHLNAGGGAVWLIDSPASRDTLDAFAPTPLAFTTERGRSAVIASARFDHPALSVFEGPSRASLVGVQLSGVWDAQAAEDAAVLLRSADGRAVLAMQTVGRGRLIVINADFSPARSDFASQPAFVPLINELVRIAAPGPGMPLPTRPGEPMPDALTAAPQLQQPSADAGVVSVDHFTSPGAYLALDAAGSPTAGVFVELDPAESDFIRAAAPGLPGDATAAGAMRLDAGQALPRSIELWPYLIVAGLLLAGAESLLLLAFARKEGGA